MIDKIIAYEEGTLDEGETIALFQTLIDTGQAWQLQGHYGRTAEALIEAGHCNPAPPANVPTPNPCILVPGCNMPSAYSAWDMGRRAWVRGCRYHIAALDL